MFRYIAKSLLSSLFLTISAVHMQARPLQIDITKGVFAPIPVAIIGFPVVSGNADIGAIVEQDLKLDGGFNLLPDMGQRHMDQEMPPLSLWRQYSDAIVVQGHVTSNGVMIQVTLRMFDVRLNRLMKTGIIQGPAAQWRLLGHRISNAIYKELTGEVGVFDTQIVFAAQSRKGKVAQSRIAVMDYDGANGRFLTRYGEYCYSPKVATSEPIIAYGFMRNYFQAMLCLQRIGSPARTVLPVQGIGCSVDFSPNSSEVVFGDAHGESTTLKTYSRNTGRVTPLTRPYGGIAVSPSHSPDGNTIVIASDKDLTKGGSARIGAPKLYVVNKKTGLSAVISKGKGSYFSPAWSPDGQYIAFVKRLKGRYYLGVMDANGSNERMIACDHVIDHPSWAPNSRKVIFAAQQTTYGPFHLYIVDLTGRHLRKLPAVVQGASMSGNQPSWCGLIAP
jgi:TolB protein